MASPKYSHSLLCLCCRPGDRGLVFQRPAHVTPDQPPASQQSPRAVHRAPVAHFRLHQRSWGRRQQQPQWRHPSRASGFHTVLGVASGADSAAADAWQQSAAGPSSRSISGCCWPFFATRSCRSCRPGGAGGGARRRRRGRPPPAAKGAPPRLLHCCCGNAVGQCWRGLVSSQQQRRKAQTIALHLAGLRSVLRRLCAALAPRALCDSILVPSAPPPPVRSGGRSFAASWQQRRWWWVGRGVRRQRRCTRRIIGGGVREVDCFFCGRRKNVESPARSSFFARQPTGGGRQGGLLLGRSILQPPAAAAAAAATIPDAPARSREACCPSSRG